MLEAVLALGLLMIQLGLFGSMNEAVHHYDHWFLLVVVPLFATTAKLVLICLTECRCREIVRLFQFGPVIEEMEALLGSRESRAIRRVNAALCIWYLWGILWLLLFPPCGNLAEDPGSLEISLDIKPEHAPCMVFEFTCTIHLLTSAFLGVLSHAGMKMIRRMPRSFIPERGGGVPPDLLEWLPTCLVGAQPDETHTVPDTWSGSTCTICLQDYVVDDIVRQLPCGHGFHKSCTDGWLARASSCPLRCQVDVRKVSQERRDRQCRTPFVQELRLPELPQEDGNSVRSTEMAESSVLEADGLHDSQCTAPASATDLPGNPGHPGEIAEQREHSRFSRSVNSPVWPLVTMVGRPLPRHDGDVAD